MCGCVLTERPQQRVYFLGSWSNTNNIICIGFSNEIQKCYFSIFFVMIIYFLVIFSQLGFFGDKIHNKIHNKIHIIMYNKILYPIKVMIVIII